MIVSQFRVKLCLLFPSGKSSCVSNVEANESLEILVKHDSVSFSSCPLLHVCTVQTVSLARAFCSPLGNSGEIWFSSYGKYLFASVDEEPRREVRKREISSQDTFCGYYISTQCDASSEYQIYSATQFDIWLNFCALWNLMYWPINFIKVFHL